MQKRIKFLTGAVVLTALSVGAADKKPGGMQADSPVTFPERGALPSRYPPDSRTKGGTKPEEGYYLFGTPQRSLSQITAIQKAMPGGKFAPPQPDWKHLARTRRLLTGFTPPQPDWKHLSRTRRILTGGRPLRMLAMGDSIVNDTMRSGWVAKLQEAYPKAKIQATVYVRGGGGCQHYKEENRIGKFVLPLKPHIVLIGGISQKDITSIRTVIHQLRAGLPGVEVLLFTGTFGRTDPRDAKALAAARHSGTGAYGKALKALAAEERCAYLDMTAPWARYIVSSGLHPHRFYRDVVHANAFGEQILSKIMMAFWKPKP